MKPVTYIDASGRFTVARLQEIWAAREILLLLTWRDIKVRYKQTVLGVAWAVLQPLMTMLVFAVFLGLLAKVPSHGVPYPLLVFCGLVPWTLFVYALTQAASSLVNNQDLLTKVYFPRVFVPAAAVLAGMVDFALAIVTLMVICIAYGEVPTAWLALLPLYCAMAFCLAIGMALWLSSLSVAYRDVRYTVAFLTQLLFYLSPIAYSTEIVPETYRTLYGLNPIAGLVEAFRAMVLGTLPSASMVAVSCAVSLVIMVTGWRYFRRTERSFADVI